MSQVTHCLVVFIMFDVVGLAGRSRVRKQAGSYPPPRGAGPMAARLPAVRGTN